MSHVDLEYDDNQVPLSSAGSAVDKSVMNLQSEPNLSLQPFPEENRFCISRTCGRSGSRYWFFCWNLLFLRGGCRLIFGCWEYLYFFLHRMKEVRWWIRRVQNRGKHVDGAENVLVDCEKDLRDLGSWVYFQLLLDVLSIAFHRDGARHGVSHKIRFRSYAKFISKQGLIFVFLLFVYSSVDIKKEFFR